MAAPLTAVPVRGAKFWAQLLGGVLLIVVGVLVSRRAFNTWGEDFAPQYVSAWMLREGKNPYDFAIQNDGYMRHVGHVTTWANFYPPSAAVAALPATLLSYEAAHQVWFIAAFAVMFLGVWRFMAVYLPHWESSLRVLVIGLLTCAATTRWAFKVAQPGPVVLGLFGIFLAELKRDRSWVSILCGLVVVSAKVTFGIPFFLMAIALRRIRTVAIMLGFWAVLNVIGLYGMGGPAIFADYKANFAQFERPDQLNYPDPRGGNSLARTDWPYLLNAVSPDFTRNNLIGHVLTLLSMAWLAREVLRAKERMKETVLILSVAASVASLSMLAVYHHHYDMSILLLPVLGYLGRVEFRGVRAIWAYIVPVVMYAGLYPYEKAANILRSVLGDAEVLVSRPLGCAVCIVALLASFAVLRAVLRRDEARTDAELAPSPTN